MADVRNGGGATTPEERELVTKRAALATLEGELADRELDLATLHAELAAFEARYFRSVGALYAELDELEARIAEAQARHRPQEPSLREKATQARATATESARAATNVPGAAEGRFSPGHELKQLFREIARQVHPDLSVDATNRARRTRLMAEANEAYARGDEAKLQSILDDWHSSPEAVEGDGIAAELVRTIRRIHQVQQRLAAIAAEMAELEGSDLRRLWDDVATSEAGGRDLLAEMVLQLTRQVAAARRRLEHVSHSGRPPYER